MASSLRSCTHIWRQAREQELSSLHTKKGEESPGATGPLHLLLQPQQRRAVSLPQLDAAAELRRFRIQGRGGSLVRISHDESDQPEHGAMGPAPLTPWASVTKYCRLCLAGDHVSGRCPVLAAVLDEGAGPLSHKMLGKPESGDSGGCDWLSRVPERTLGIMVAIKHMASMHCTQDSGTSFGDKVCTQALPKFAAFLTLCSALQHLQPLSSACYAQCSNVVPIQQK